MIIKISNLSDDVHIFNFDESVKEVGLGEPFSGNYQANIELAKTHNQIILDTEITLNANFECDRCGKTYSQKIKSDYKMVYLFGVEPEDSDAINITYLPVDAAQIEIGDDIRDYALLAVPMKKLCKEDCKGICRYCGTDLNENTCDCENKQVDPRWQPLLELKNKLNIN